MSKPVHLCRFSSLDDLTKTQRKEPTMVLRALDKAKRFSDFEVDARLGSTLMTCFRKGWLERTGGEYPWTEVRVTEAGYAQFRSEP